MKRRILTTFTLLLAALLTLALVSCGPDGTEETRAEETTAETIEETTKGTMEKTTEDSGYSKGLLYRRENSGYSVIGIESPDRDIIIPATHGGEPVTGIGDEAFKDCTGLTSITIPDSVTSIGRAAFAGCTGLFSITIPDSVSRIGDSAFCRCTSLESITLPFVENTHFKDIFDAGRVPASLKRVVITKATSIGDWEFADCASLTSITIPDGVTSIGDYAINSERDFRKTQQKISNNIENSLQMIA